MFFIPRPGARKQRNFGFGPLDPHLRSRMTDVCIHVVEVGVLHCLRTWVVRIAVSGLADLEGAAQVGKCAHALIFKFLPRSLLECGVLVYR